MLTIWHNPRCSKSRQTLALLEANGLTPTVRRYLDEMDGELSTDFYDLVLCEVEAPLLQAVMEYTRANQSRAAHMLGLNRGTLRKKLKRYDVDGRRPLQ